MRKTIISVLLGALMAIGSMALGAPGPTDDNNNNLFGLCTAYFNGSQNGQDHKRQAPPFQGLESYVGTHDGVDNDGDGTKDEADEGDKATPTDVWNYCQKNGGVGGQPEDPTDGDTEGNGKNGRGRG